MTNPHILETRRLHLEASLTQLRESLQTWRVYSAEYEALHEELQTLCKDASREVMVRYFWMRF
jgi:hypothetical protein